MADTELSVLQQIRDNLGGQGEVTIGDLKNELQASGKAYRDAIAKGDVTTQQMLKERRAELKAQITYSDSISKYLEMADETANEQIEQQEKLQYSLPALFGEGLQKFLGLDFKEKLFAIGDAVKNLPSTLESIFSKIPLFDKAKDAFGGFFDIIKTGLALAGAVIGLQAFLDGWSKAEAWFGDNPDFFDRFAAGLANIARSFLGLDDGQTEELAKNIRAGIQYIEDFVRWMVTDVIDVVKVTLDQITPIGNGIKKLMQGDITGGFSDLFGSTKEIASALLDNAGAMAALVLFFGPGKILGAITGMIGSAVSLGGHLVTLGTKMASLSKAAFAAVGNVPKGVFKNLGIAALAGSLINGLITAFTDGYDEYKKSGSFTSAIMEGVKGFGLGILEALTLGLFDTKEIEAGIGKVFKGAFDVVGMIGDVIGVIIDGFKSFINGIVETVNSKLPEFAQLGIPFPEVQVQVPEGYTYNDLLKSIATNENLTQEEKQREFDRTLAAQKEGVDLRQYVVQNQSNQVIAAQFKPTVGASGEYAIAN